MPYTYNLYSARPKDTSQFNAFYVAQHLAPWEDQYDLGGWSLDCKTSQVTVPKSMGNMNVADAIDAFCTTYNGTRLSPATDKPFQFRVDIVYDIFPLTNATAFWLSANFRKKAPAYCMPDKGNVSMVYEDCHRVLNYM